jgi:hypothetical protein
MKFKIKENNMNIAKSLTSLSLALAMVGGLVLLAPSSTDAAGKSNAFKNKGRICFSGNNFCHDMKKNPKPTPRPCNRKGFACIH